MYKFICLLIISTIMSSCNSADESRWNPDDITNQKTDVRPYIKDKVFLSILYEASGVKQGDVLRLEDLLRIQNLEIDNQDYNFELRSLDGIQLLRNLFNFNCYNLIGVEEPDFSYNKHLELVNISNIEVGKLDFSQNLKLRILLLHDSRSLKEIKLPSDLESLSLLSCYRLVKPKINHLKKISALDIRSCLNIIELDELWGFSSLRALTLENLDIPSIDLSNCTKLFYLQIIECLWLDNIEMGDVNTLENLSLDYNQERELPLDISVHKNLNSLSIERSLISVLDVSNNLGLEKLICRDNPFLECVYISKGQEFDKTEVDPYVIIIEK